MPRRVSLPAADELFRTTGGPGVQPSSPQPNPAAPPTEHGRQPPAAPAEQQPAADEHSGRGARPARPAVPGQPGGAGAASRGGAPNRGGAVRQSAGGGQSRRRSAPRRPSGRERHDEKITVYVSAEELMDLEHARLVLRGEHGLAVDRGRIVREAVAVVLADLESRGDASILVRRLRG